MRPDENHPGINVAGSMRFVAFILCSLILGAPSQAQDVRAILLRSIGGERALQALISTESVKSSGTMTLNGEQGTFVQYFVPPDHYYMEATFEAFSLAQGYDGETAWQRDLNGQVSVVEGYAKQQMLETIYFESLACLFSDSLDREAAYLGLVATEDEVYHQIAFFPFGTDSIYVYFDTTTGLRRFTQTRLDQLEVLTYIDDYREVSGVLTPFYTLAEIPEAGLTTEMYLDTVEVNFPVAEEVFSQPSEMRVDYRFPSDVDRLTIPFEYAHGHIRLEVIINGQSRVWMILDSGSSTNILHAPVADALGLASVGSLPAMGVGGFADVTLVRTDSLQIGGLTLYGQVAGKVDLGKLSKEPGEGEFGGLLGYDFLSRLPILVDYADSTLTIFNPDSFQPDSGGIVIPFHLTMQVPTVAGEVNGIGGDFVVDLGNAFGLVLHRDFVLRNQLEQKLDDIRDISSLFGGVGGAVSGRTAYAAVFRIDDILLQSLRVILPDSAAGMVGSEELAGNIGNLVLENFGVLFDYRSSRLILYPDRGSAEN
ncbi:MAG: retropepsin-like domain-containing protein [Candidatus Zixiibacteriota bacterium]|nr:MAG: retropepsin-like domain-containing protein [candidate division Zixibacteria bacterium]